MPKDKPFISRIEFFFPTIYLQLINPSPILPREGFIFCLLYVMWSQSVYCRTGHRPLSRSSRGITDLKSAPIRTRASV